MEENKMIKQTKFGYMDFSNMAYEFNRIQWEKSVGKIIHFEYKDINTHLIINKYCKDNCMVNITVPGYVDNYDILTSQILYGQLGRVLGKKNPDFLYKVGEVVNMLLILDSYKTENKKYKIYKYRCLNDGYEGTITEDQLKRGQGCSLCANKVVVRGVNDIGTTHSCVACMLFDKNDQYKYSAHSKKKTYFLCQNCGEKIYATINDVVRRGLKCHRCNDGFSYPNKFVYSLIKQVLELHDTLSSVNFEVEKTFDWSKNVAHDNNRLSGNKIYDIYIPLDSPIIIENHGLQHFKRAYCKNGRTLREEQENDKIKKDLALSNGIQEDNYIVLDCSKSDMVYIKNSIMNSKLPVLLNFNDDQINWNECNRFATSSRVYEACLHWNNGIKNYKDISFIMKMNKETIRKYIKRGRELGIVTV